MIPILETGHDPDSIIPNCPNLRKSPTLHIVYGITVFASNVRSIMNAIIRMSNSTMSFHYFRLK